MPQTMQSGHFVVVATLVNPKAAGSGAHGRYAALLALVAKFGNGRFTAAQWAGVVGRASDLRYNTATNGYGKAFAAVYPTAAAAAAAVAKLVGKAPAKAKAKASTGTAAPAPAKAKAKAPAPASTAAPAPAPAPASTGTAA